MQFLRCSNTDMDFLSVLCLVAIIGAAAEARDVPGATNGPWAMINSPSWLQQMLGKRHKGTECDEIDFRKSLLSPIKEMPFVGLFSDIKGQTKFEASGMTVAPDSSGKDWLWIVFDNLHSLGKVDEHFEFRDKRNQLVGEVGEDSQFEGITYVASTGHFFTVEEIYDDEEHGMEPYAHELKLSDDGTTYTTIQACPVHYQFTHENKGFEGLHYHEDEHGHKYLLGLCEGNYCTGGEEGREAGNGRIIVSEYNGKDGDECGWDVIKEVRIPSTANFVDYSGMAFRGSKVAGELVCDLVTRFPIDQVLSFYEQWQENGCTYHVRGQSRVTASAGTKFNAAIVSQENSAMWVGTFDFEALEFTSEGDVYNFPRDNHCDMIYCNVEGVQWLDDIRFVISSDKAKKDQPFRCVDKEQRVAIFALPEGSDDPTPSVSSQGAKNTRPLAGDYLIAAA